MEREAVNVAADAGVKVTDIAQLAPASSELPHVLVCAKSPGFAPVMVMPVIVSGAFPVFFRLAVCAAVVMPATAVKLNEDGVSETMGAVGATPVPLSVAV